VQLPHANLLSLTVRDVTRLALQNTSWVRLLLIPVLAATATALQDLSFKRGVVLTAQRPERVSGLCAHFDVAWTCRGRLEGGLSAGPIFSTGPLAPSTSWLQTVFSFPKALKMEAGQQLSVDFDVEPVGLPPGRMLDVSVQVEFQGMRATVPYQLKR